MPEDIDLPLPPALEAFGADFAREMELALDRPRQHPSRPQRGGRGVRRRRGRGGGWRRLGVLVFLAGSATAAAATIPWFGGSHRLTGAVPTPALTSPGGSPGAGGTSGPVRLPAGLRYAIAVTPDLEAGDTSWCSSPQFTLPGARTQPIGGGTACAPAIAHAVTIVAGGAALTNVFSGLPNPHQGDTHRGHVTPASLQRAVRQTGWINWFVVSDQVAAIRVGTESFIPRPDPELAPGWRAVVYFDRGGNSSFALLDRRGRSVNEAGTQAQFDPPTVPVTTVNPRHLPKAVCSLAASDLPGVASQWEVVADRAPARGSRVQPNALFSCARAWYAFPGQRTVYSAAILLNAQNPARAAPTLPGLTPSTQPGNYEEAASNAGQITAKRVGNAWILVQGPDQQQRIALLNTTKIAGTAIQH